MTAEEEISAMTEEDELPGVIAEEMPGATEEEERSVMTEDEELASSAVAEESGCVSGALEALSEQEVRKVQAAYDSLNDLEKNLIIIATIRACKGGQAEAKIALMEKFEFDEPQAAAIGAVAHPQLPDLPVGRVLDDDARNGLDARLARKRPRQADQGRHGRADDELAAVDLRILVRAQVDGARRPAHQLELAELGNAALDRLADVHGSGSVGQVRDFNLYYRDDGSLNGVEITNVERTLGIS